MPDFDPAAELIRLRTDAAIRRKRRFRPSRLDRFTAELLALRRAGARAAELQRWLSERRIRVAHSTVLRWLARYAQ